MAKLVPMLGAVLAHVSTPKDSKLRPKPHSPKKFGQKVVTHGEKSVTQPGQQHGELATAMEPKKLTDRMQMREHAKGEKRRATESWISGHMTTEEHNNVHRRADHVLAGKHPSHYSGKSGERKMKLR